MWWCVGVLGLSLMGWAALSTRRILYPERRTIPPPARLPPHSVHTLTAPDGAVFDVWLLEAPAPKARLLLCHGYYANRFQLLDIAQGLRSRGYDTLLMEMRGHGDRAGPCTLGLRESRDALAILEWARRRDAQRPLPVGVLGLSMGAAVACLAAFHDAEVRAVVVDSVYSRLFPVLRRSMWQRHHVPTVPLAWITWWSLQIVLGARLPALDPAALASRLRQPLLAIQGGEDRRVVPLLGREFYARWAGPKTRWFEPQVAHVGMFAHHPEEYSHRVADFFDRALGPAPQERPA